MTEINFDILPLRSAILANHDSELHALVRVQGPARAEGPQAARKPLNLSLVLDRSGSMSGAPLEEARRCAAFVIEQLSPADRASIIVYDNKIDVVVPSMNVVDKSLFLREIDRISARGSTALFDGWQAGAIQAEEFSEQDYISRVLLLSDGCANVGLTDAEEIVSYCAQKAEKGVSTSTYGLGHHFNELLMMEMAKSGEGQGYYGESAEDLMDPFCEEFSLLSALCAKDMKLRLSAAPGVTLKVLNDYKLLDDGSWRLQNLAYEGEVWVLVKLTIPSSLASAGGTDDIELLNAVLTCVDIESGEPAGFRYTLRLPRLPAPAWSAVVEDERVKARCQEVRVAQIQLEIREAALQGRWEAVDVLLSDAKREAGSNAWLQASLAELEKYSSRRDSMRTSKESYYSSGKMVARMAHIAEDASLHDSKLELDIPAFLRRQSEQGKRIRR